MTLPLPSAELLALQSTAEPRPDSAVAGSPSAATRNPGDEPLQAAARKFEALFVKQLLDALRRSMPDGSFSGGTSATSQYMGLFDQALADEISESGGVGLARMLAQTMRGPEAAENNTDSSHDGLGSLAELGLGGPDASPAGLPLSGGAGRLQEVATKLLADPERWAKDGTLTQNELGSELAIQVPGGLARFNVRDALGYRGYTKCNLFALEMARRAGFQVPVTGRAHGWGYPSAQAIAADAADNQLRAGWGKVVTGKSAQALDRAIVEQGRAFILSGSGRAKSTGHMAVLERVHGIEYGQHGKIEKLVFDGWEARPEGVQHLVRRAWMRAGESSGPAVRRGFEDIEIIELSEAASELGAERLLGPAAGASLRDKLLKK